MTTGRRLLVLTSVAALAVAFGAVTAFADIPLNGDERKCVDALNKRGGGVAKAQNKIDRSCVKDAGKGKIPAADSCLDGDPKGKVADKRAKTTADFSSKCGDVPDVGPNDATAVNDAAENQPREMTRNLFGDLGTAVIDCATDKDNCKCQDAVIKNAGKIFDTKMKVFGKCKKGLANISTAADIQGCVGPDPDAKIAGKVAKLGDDIGKKCGGVPATNAFPGDCTGLGGTALRDCVDRLVECHFCLAVNGMDNTNLDCDIFDDGIDNNTCASPGPPPCPVAAGRYTVSQVNTQAPGGPNCTAGAGNPCPAGTICDVNPPGDGLCHGTLKVDGFAPFPFPAGGYIKEEVSAASQPDCIHNIVVPFTMGCDPNTSGSCEFFAPTFCSIAALNFSTKVAQDGCGKGYMDSNGGSDFTVQERGDSSPTGAPCSIPTVCANGANSNVRVDLKLGNGVMDTCSAPGTANVFVSIPVHTVTWQEINFNCPDPDGVFNPGTDTLITDFDQNLDFTTDATDADWQDLDGDGCCINGSGPGALQSFPMGVPTCNPAPAGLSSSGACLDPVGGTVTTAGTGTIGSNGGPVFDLTFSNRLVNTVTGPVAPTGAVCGLTIPPVTGGTIVRCIP